MVPYKIRLARNEGVEYRDAHDVYRFNLSLTGYEWTLTLPGTKGDNFETHELSKEEEARVLTRIVDYLSTIKWLGFIPVSYTVKIVREPEPRR